jgi:hypothetical protein
MRYRGCSHVIVTKERVVILLAIRQKLRDAINTSRDVCYGLNGWRGCIGRQVVSIYSRLRWKRVLGSIRFGVGVVDGLIEENIMNARAR